MQVRLFLTLAIVMLLVGSKLELYSQSNYRYIKNDAFGFGERLEYQVGIITGAFAGLGGSGGLQIENKPVMREGRECYNVNFWVDSEGIVDMTFPIHDKYRTVIDVAGIFPYEFYQRIREGKFKRDFKATFDHTNNLAFVGDKKYNIEKYTHDILSAFFYARTLDLSAMKDGDIFYLRNFYKDTTFSLPIKLVKREVVKVPAGKFKTILLQPIIADGFLFKFHNDINLWLTDDDRKIPVKVSTSTVVGEAGAELKKYSGMRGKVSAKLE